MENAEELEKLLAYQDDENVLAKLKEIKKEAKSRIKEISQDDTECGD